MAAAETIPVIDLGPYLAGASGALDRTAQALRFALTEIGFYFIVNHGVSRERIQRTFEQVKRFHELPVDKNVKLPKADNVLDMVEAPMVAITGTQILVDGVPAGSTRAIEDANRLQRVDELFNILKNKRELWKQLNPAKEFPGVIILQVDRKVQALVVKSVFQTSAYAGYPNVSFMVGRLGDK